MPTIKSLRAFVLTMEQGSLTLAAQTMNLSQPAASRLLQQLEDEFGAPLFYRDSKTLTPSREAELFYPEASRILASFQEIPEILDKLKQDRTLPFKVMGQTRCALGLVVPALAQLNRENPDLSVDLAIYKRTELTRRLVWDRFDVGVFAMPLHIEFAETRALRSVELKVVLPVDHPLASAQSLSADQIQHLPFVTVKEGLIGRTVVDEALARVGQSLNVTHEVSNAFAAVSLVRQGMGFMITDEFAIDPGLMDALCLIPFDPAPRIQYAICEAKDARAHPLKEKFIEILLDLLDRQPTGADAHL